MLGRAAGHEHASAGAEARRRSDQLLERFDLVDAGRRRVANYSGGMRRRLDLAATLVTGRVVLFSDEPTTGLDPRSRQQMWDVITELVGGGLTVFLTSQYLEEADRLAVRIAVLDAGRVVAERTARELERRVAGPALTSRSQTRAHTTRSRWRSGTARSTSTRPGPWSAWSRRPPRARTGSRSS